MIGTVRVRLENGGSVAVTPAGAVFTDAGAEVLEPALVAEARGAADRKRAELQAWRARRVAARAGGPKRKLR